MPSPKLPIIGQSIVAKFWPGGYFFVSTIWLDPSEPLSLLTRSLETNELLENITPGPDRFVTQVFRANKYGIPKSFDKPLYEKEYLNQSDAKAGHDETVTALEKGRLKFSHLG